MKKHIQQCEQCQKNKSKWHKSYEKLQSLKAANESWQSIIVNFIVKLSKFKKSITEFEYNSIMIVIDKFMKKIIRKIEKYFKIKIVKKLLLFQELIYMLLTTRKKMIEQHHDDILTEHFEINKMMKWSNQKTTMTWQFNKIRKYDKFMSS